LANLKRAAQLMFLSGYVQGSISSPYNTGNKTDRYQCVTVQAHVIGAISSDCCELGGDQTSWLMSIEQSALIIPLAMTPDLQPVGFGEPVVPAGLGELVVPAGLAPAAALFHAPHKNLYLFPVIFQQAHQI
jgi:hypothetical protein